MNDEKLAQAMNDGRMVNIAENLLFPLLEDEIALKLNLMCNKYREGKQDFLSEVAYITMAKDLINKLKVLQRQGNRALKELHERQES
jgi:Ran GTPase-activating protein (RanGAP) involved in mRNA processing and transport